MCEIVIPLRVLDISTPTRSRYFYESIVYPSLMRSSQMNGGSVMVVVFTDNRK
jgi:hypothetical protein